MGVYARILRAPGVATIVVATAIGRLPIGISGLAILLYVQEVHGSFAAAGVAAGALALGSAAGAPLQGRLIDWRGEGALLPLSFAHAGALVESYSWTAAVLAAVAMSAAGAALLVARRGTLTPSRVAA
jgi:MFS family permease